MYEGNADIPGAKTDGISTDQGHKEIILNLSCKSPKSLKELSAKSQKTDEKRQLKKQKLKKKVKN